MIGTEALQLLFRECIRVLWRGIASEVSGLWNDTLAAIVDIARAFPNVWKMADIVALWATSLTGRLIVAPISGLEATLILYLTKAKLHNRLMRVDDAVRLLFTGPKAFLHYLTFTGEQGLLSWIGQQFAMTTYRTVKRFKLLSKLISASSAEEFAAAFIQSWLGRASRTIWVILFVLVFAFFAAEASWLAALFFGFGFLSGESQRLILPQDSKRSYRRRGGMRRVNVRRGPDTVDSVRTSRGELATAA